MKIKLKDSGEIREVIEKKDGKVYIALTPSFFTWLNPEDYEIIN
jgi:hypothetical protein